MQFFLTSPHYLSQYLILLFLIVMFLSIPQTSFTMLLSMCINDLSPSLSLSFFHTHTLATGVLLGRRQFDRDTCECVGRVSGLKYEAQTDGEVKWIQICARICAVKISLQIAKKCLIVGTDLGDRQHRGGSTAAQHTDCTNCWCHLLAKTANCSHSQIHQIKLHKAFLGALYSFPAFCTLF